MPRTERTHTAIPSPFSHSKVVALRNMKTGTEYLIEGKGRVIIGSSDSCEIPLLDPYVSKQHCALRREGRCWSVHDIGSKNGTRLNNTLIQSGHLFAGSILSVGHTDLLAVGPQQRRSVRESMYGTAPVFCQAVQKAQRVARSGCSVLILGETGTGKELFARLIHECSPRAHQPFVALNCGGMSKELVSSELFGHVKGAFTGATTSRKGLFSMANGGTLFLDELGELPMEQQPHLLRTLQSGLIRPVGAELEELVDTRVIAATNRLHIGGYASPIRQDLYHRLSSVTIDVPALRERKQDVPGLVRHFLKLGEAEHGPRTVDDETLCALAEHEWRGNIRELENAVKSALLLGETHLTFDKFLPNGLARPNTTSSCRSRDPLSQFTGFQLRQREILFDAYKEHRSIRLAARQTGLAKSTFADLCKRYGIDTSRSNRRH